MNKEQKKICDELILLLKGVPKKDGICWETDCSECYCHVPCGDNGIRSKVDELFEEIKK